MRVTDTTGKLRVQAIAGTYVVMLGFDMDEQDCKGLLGFSVHRTSHDEDEAGYIKGMKCFAETDPGFEAGAQYSTQQQPVQSFQWADYSAKPGQKYTYKIVARKGTPAKLTRFAQASVTVTTEKEIGTAHDVHFNRGISASQEYSRRFGERTPDQVGDPDDFTGNPAYAWLSRGLFESLQAYIRSAKAGEALRVAAYEFAFLPVHLLLKDAESRGVDVRIVYDARRDEKGNPGKPNDEAVSFAGLDAISRKRTRPKSTISHNKFIVHLVGGQPQSVWTGGMNFSRSGIFGHSNVAHVVKDPVVAKGFMDYWTELDADPDAATLKAKVEAISPLPADPPPPGNSFFFSPRQSEDGLQRMADWAMQAKTGLFMTFAFGMNDKFKQVYRNSTAKLRFALMEQKTRPMAANDPQRAVEEAAIQALRNMPENVFAVGSFIATNAIDGWLKEKLSGLSTNVKYVHNKFMLIDPLSNDPIVVSGSANFSKASIVDNDENMIVVRGNKRVADIYLGEYMRLWSHHAFRESLQWREPDNKPKFLRTDAWWQDYFGVSERSSRRQYFAPV